MLDVGCGEGQIARLARDRRGDAASSASIRRARQIVGRHERGGGPAYARAAADALPVPPTPFDAVVACLVFEHIARRRRRDRRGRPRVLRPGGRFLFFLNHPLLQTPNSGWIDDQVLDPPEQYWRIGRYLVEDVTIEEVEKDVFIPFIHRPLSRYVNALASGGPRDPAHGRAGPAARLPRPGRRVRGGRDDPPTPVPARGERHGASEERHGVQSDRYHRSCE